MLEEHLKEELILLNLDASNREELFKQVANTYLEKGLVTEGYYECLSQREDNYPTGLQMEDYSVGIPHGEPEHVKESFVSIVTLTEPITIYKMENPEESVPIDVFFFLGLGDGALHLNILRETIGVIQEKTLIKKLKQASSAKDALALVKEVLSLT